MPRLLRYLEANPLRAGLLESRWEEEELKALRTCVVRGRPFGDDDWVERPSRKLGLEFTLRRRGRPRKEEHAAKSGKI